MTFDSAGDLASVFQNRRQNSELNKTLLRLSQELASGLKSDVSSVNTGDYNSISAIENSLRSATAYLTVTTETAFFAASKQSALGQIQEGTTEFATALLAAGTSADASAIEISASDALLKFDATLSVLNLQVANRYVFSGNATDRPAVASKETILGAVQSAIVGETTAAGIEGALDSWFDSSGGGYETIAFTGSLSKMAPIQLSDDTKINLETTAAGAEIRTILKGLAMATLVKGDTFSGTPDEQAILAIRAGEILLTSQEQITQTRAKLGAAEAKIDNVATNNSAKTSALEIAQANITAVDPYLVATQLEAVQLQLESFYMITARLSRLSLTDFLR